MNCWLADHLYESAKMVEQPMSREEKLSEAARIRKEREKALWANMPRISKEELVPSQKILDIVKDIEPMQDEETSVRNLIEGERNLQGLI